MCEPSARTIGSTPAPFAIHTGRDGRDQRQPPSSLVHSSNLRHMKAAVSEPPEHASVSLDHGSWPPACTLVPLPAPDGSTAHGLHVCIATSNQQPAVLASSPQAGALGLVSGDPAGKHFRRLSFDMSSRNPQAATRMLLPAFLEANAVSSHSQCHPPIALVWSLARMQYAVCTMRCSSLQLPA